MATPETTRHTTTSTNGSKTKTARTRKAPTVRSVACKIADLLDQMESFEDSQKVLQLVPMLRMKAQSSIPQS